MTQWNNRYMHRIIKGISKEETTFSLSMAVQIAEKKESLFTLEVCYQFLDGKDLRLLFWIRIFVVSVEVVVIDVHSVMS